VRGVIDARGSPGRDALSCKIPSQATYPEGVMRHVPARCAWACAAWLAMLPVCPVAWAVSATGVTMSQKNAALEFLQALASGDPEAVACAIPPEGRQVLRIR